MLKRFASLLIFLGLLSGSAHAGVCSGGTLPFNLLNGTLADASQVMSNYNAIIASVTATCAASGTNNDITAINGLTTPLSIPQGGSRVYAGSVPTTGTVNAAIVTTLSPSGYTLTQGNIVCFIPSGPNTGAVTLAANGTAVTNVVKQGGASGVAPLSGGEMNSGEYTCVIYDNTNYEIIGTPVQNGQLVPSGTILDYAGTTAPAGYLFCDGASYSTTGPTAVLFGIIGFTYGGSGSSFNVPDLRGRVGAGNDAVAHRLNSGTIGSVAGNATQTITLTTAQMAAHTHNYSGTTSTETANHVHDYQSLSDVAGGTGYGYQSPGSLVTRYSGSSSVATTTESALHAHTYSGTTDNGTGTSAGVNIAQPTVIINKIIKMRWRAPANGNELRQVAI